MNRHPAKVHLGPNLSQAGPAATRTSNVAIRATMLELRTSAVDMLRSLAMVTVRSGGNAYQDQKAMKKPNQEKNQTRPYMSIGFKAGMVRAFLFTGFTSGAWYRSIGLNMTADVTAVQSQTRVLSRIV